MPGFNSFRRLSPAREFSRFGRQRRGARQIQILLTSFFMMCLIIFYTDSLSSAKDFWRPSLETQPLPAQLRNATGEESSAITSEQYTDDKVASTEPFETKSQGPLQPTKLQDADFGASFARVEDLFPGEMESRLLLDPIQGTGAEKLREIGLRARQYTEFFKAWERLHFVESGPDSTFIRPDMLQYIRQHYSAVSDEIPAASVDHAIHVYERFKSFLCKFGQLMAGWTAPYFADHMSLHLNFKHGGRGIVVTAGGSQAPHLKTLIHSLRDLGCTLPIEVMYLDDGDLEVDIQVELETLDGVITREIAPMVDDQGWKLAGWALKPFAMLFSSFREIIFIDADSSFFRNPEMLFEDEDYVRTGALFFKDRTLWPEWKRDWLKDLLPRPISAQVLASRYWRGESGHMQESGVVVVDKWRHFISMLIVCRMNGPERNGNKEQGTKGVYDMVYGDKETFWLGWELVGDTDYSFHRGGVAVMGVAEAKETEKKLDVEEPPPEELKRSDEETVVPPAPEKPSPAAYQVCAPQLLHLDANGSPLWFNGGILRNKFSDEKEREFGKFEEYISEPKNVSSAAWELLSHNEACLTAGAEHKHSLTEEEKEAVQMIIRHAKNYL